MINFIQWPCFPSIYCVSYSLLQVLLYEWQTYRIFLRTLHQSTDTTIHCSSWIKCINWTLNDTDNMLLPSTNSTSLIDVIICIIYKTFYCITLIYGHYKNFGTNWQRKRQLHFMQNYKNDYIAILCTQYAALLQ